MLARQCPRAHYSSIDRSSDRRFVYVMKFENRQLFTNGIFVAVWQLEFFVACIVHFTYAAYTLYSVNIRRSFFKWISIEKQLISDEKQCWWTLFSTIPKTKCENWITANVRVCAYVWCGRKENRQHIARCANATIEFQSSRLFWIDT